MDSSSDEDKTYDTVVTDDNVRVVRIAAILNHYLSNVFCELYSIVALVVSVCSLYYSAWSGRPGL